ncbi:MAG: M48 family metalloprotease [Pirellulaceae bacterium]
MIRFKCPGCGNVLKAPVTAAGKTAKCNQCQTRIKIPTPAKPTTPAKPRTQAKPKTPQVTDTAASLTLTSGAVSESTEDLFGDSMFGDLPDFAAPPALVPKPAQQTLSDSMISDLSHESAQQDSPVVEDRMDESGIEDFSAALERATDLAARDTQAQLKKNAIAVGAKLTPKQIASAFGSAIQPISKSEGYSSSLTKVASTMVALPVAFVAAVVLGTMLMVWLFMGWLSAEPTGEMLNPLWAIGFVTAAFLLLAAWIPVFTMVFAGVNLVFSGPPERPGTRPLSRDEQPALYEFVDQICQKLNAPSPTRIDLDCQYNASASFDRGWISLNKKEYVLTIGVPLIASHSAEQLASVIAHEFGHFCQSGGMRAHYLIRHLNGWFINAAINKTIRDEVNDYIAANSDLGAFGLIWTVYYWIGWLGRQMMFFFGSVGHGFSGSLSREMEYDADKYAVHLAGSKHFADSMTQVEKHAVAYSVTVDNLKDMFQHGILVNNIPRFTMYVAKTMPGAVVRKIAEQMEKQNQDRFDSHPPTRDRIAAAKQLKQSGILKVGRPAVDLVNHWTKLCEDITLDFYSGVTGQTITKDNVCKLEDVLAAEHKLLLDKTVS